MIGGNNVQKSQLNAVQMRSWILSAVGWERGAKGIDIVQFEAL
jgi:hypothetical protein